MRRGRRGQRLGLARGAHRFLAVVVLVVGASAPIGCGGDDPGTASGPDSVKVGVIPIIDVAPLYLGIERGFFSDEKLAPEPVLAQGGAAIVPAVQSGDFQFGFSNNTSLMIAASKGLPICIVSEAVKAGTNKDKSYVQLLVKRGEGIDGPEDLEGKTIAVNTLENVASLTINTALSRQGVAIRTLHFTEVPYPEMVAALAADRVDAIWVAEPFVSQAAKELRVRNVSSTMIETQPNYSVSSYFTSRRLAEESPDVVDRFRQAMKRSLAYAQSHPDEVRRILAKYTDIPKALATQVFLPDWTSDLNRESLDLTARLAKKYDYLEDQPAVEDMICE